MTTNPAHPVLETKRSRFRGSLTGTLVRTLLVFTLIPLVLMAGSAYFRTRTLLREQAAAQSQNLLFNQLEVIDREIKEKESHLEEALAAEGIPVLIEIALHANPQSDEFRDIRNQFLAEVQVNEADFDQILLVDNDGNITIASNADWQGNSIDSDLIGADETHSIALHSPPPLYEDQFVLLTAVHYQTERGSNLGTVIGMIDAFDKIAAANNISPAIVAGGIKIALLTTVFGLITAIILQIFYNYLVSKIEAITGQMEEASIGLVDMLVRDKMAKA